MARPDDIVGYVYRADVWCFGDCILSAVSRDHDVHAYVWLDPEGVLEEFASGLGIIREAEETFDSGTFPKVIFRDQVEDPDEACCVCSAKLDP